MFVFDLHSDQETSSETTVHPQTAGGSLVDVRWERVGQR